MYFVNMILIISASLNDSGKTELDLQKNPFSVCLCMTCWPCQPCTRSNISFWTCVDLFPVIINLKLGTKRTLIYYNLNFGYSLETLLYLVKDGVRLAEEPVFSLFVYDLLTLSALHPLFITSRWQKITKGNKSANSFTWLSDGFFRSFTEHKKTTTYDVRNLDPA
jgi:hypothetical protein